MKKMNDLLIMENCPHFTDGIESTETIRTPEHIYLTTWTFAIVIYQTVVSRTNWGPIK